MPVYPYRPLPSLTVLYRPLPSFVEQPIGRRRVHHAFVDQLGHIPGHRADLRLHPLGSRRRLIRPESAIRVGEPGAQRFEHPRLHLDRRLGDLDAADGPARIESDRQLERSMLAIDAHEDERPTHLVLMLADVECDDTVRRLPADRVVQPLGVGAAEMQLARGKLVGAGQETVHGVLPLYQNDRWCDVQQRGRYRAQNDRLHGFLNHIPAKSSQGAAKRSAMIASPSERDNGKPSTMSDRAPAMTAYIGMCN